MSSVISVRVPREVKEILEESGVDINREVRAFLEELAWKIKLKRHMKSGTGFSLVSSLAVKALLLEA
jgi:hypothetical protein